MTETLSTVPAVVLNDGEGKEGLASTQVSSGTDHTHSHKA